MAAAGDQTLCSALAWVPRVSLEHLDHVDLPEDTLGLSFTHSGPGRVGSISSLILFLLYIKRFWEARVHNPPSSQILFETLFILGTAFLLWIQVALSYLEPTPTFF